MKCFRYSGENIYMFKMYMYDLEVLNNLAIFYVNHARKSVPLVDRGELLPSPPTPTHV